MIFGYICFTRQDPETLFKPLGMAALYISAFAGGFASARFNKENGLPVGALTGVLLMLFVLIISFFLRQANESIGLVGWLLYALIALAGALGGRVGIPSAKRRKRRGARKIK